MALEEVPARWRDAVAAKIAEDGAGTESVAESASIAGAGASEDASTEDASAEASAVDLSGMTKAQLVEHAATLGITLTMSQTKAEMLAALGAA